MCHSCDGDGCEGAFGDLLALHAFVHSWGAKGCPAPSRLRFCLGEGIDLDLQMLRQSLPCALRAIALVAEVCVCLPLGHPLEVYGEEAILSIDPRFDLGHCSGLQSPHSKCFCRACAGWPRRWSAASSPLGSGPCPAVGLEYSKPAGTTHNYLAAVPAAAAAAPTTWRRRIATLLTPAGRLPPV